MEKQFKVGDKVYSLAHGWGEVKEIDQSEWPIDVTFNNGSFGSFFKDGRLHEDGPKCLFHYEPEITKPAWKPKEGEWCWFWDKGFVTAILARFRTLSSYGRFNAYVGKSDCNYEFCAPFTGELPEHLK